MLTVLKVQMTDSINNLTSSDGSKQNDFGKPRCRNGRW